MSPEVWMNRAIALAQQGVGWVSPNPLVGAVIVKDGAVIGEGYHEKRGEAHAERNALAACTESPEGATVYVTLEPCCHHGKTPPCTDALIEAGVKKVVIGSRDPNPKVAGKGAERLRAHGIDVVEDFMRVECDELNPIFFHYITKNWPYVAMKYAMTADGKLATHTGASQWITGEAARDHVQSLRNRYRAIMVGIGTVLADNPRLNCRMPGGRDPIRVICDSRLRIPMESKIVKTAEVIPTIVACNRPDAEKRTLLTKAGVLVWEVPLNEGGLNLEQLFQWLAQEQEVDSVLVEGGNELLGSILGQRLAHKLYCYIGAKLFGGRDAKSPIGGVGAVLPSHGVLLHAPKMQAFEGGDILLEYQVKER